MPFPFAEICTLLQRHEDLKRDQRPILNPADRQTRGKTLSNVTQSWFKSHRTAIARLNAESSVALLSTLLPERRTDRVYNIKSQRLVHILSRSLGFSAARTKDLLLYAQPGHGDLAECLERVLGNSGPPARPAVTLEEVDDMLQILAGACQFSGPELRQIPPGSSEARDALIGNILKRLQPRESKWLVRLILKDFSPVRLNEQEILKGYHFMIPSILQFQDNFDAAVRLLKNELDEYPPHPDPRSERLHFRSASEKLKPTVGVKVGRPHFHKARSIEHCLRMLGGTRWVLERKYDGEYCEIHIDLSKSNNVFDCLTIFSKSGKNSTEDRKPLHPILVDALRLGKPNCKIKRRAVLLGEMVVYSDKDQRILPFDEIRKHVLRSGRAIGTDADSCPKGGEHLAIVFFDILLLDDKVIMDRPVEERRCWLREAYRKIVGRAMGAEWKTVDFGAAKPSKRLLMQQFAASIAQRCEGLVLKPCGVPYFSLEANPTSYAHSFIKLKKDYILDMGDEADFAVVGASYNAQQAANNSILAAHWTEFHLGCLVNKAEVLRFDARPRFKVMGSVQSDHCIPRPVLQAANALARFCTAPHKPNEMPANFDLETQPGMKLEVVFSTPFVFEVLGSGFEKPSNYNFFMLRHARVKKLHEDRSFKDAVSMQELQEMASTVRSAAVDSESQETRRWLARLEKKSQRKFERERTTTPRTRTSGTPTTTVPSTGRTKVASPPATSTSLPLHSSPVDGTTLISSASPFSAKRPRGEEQQTPCHTLKRQRTDPEEVTRRVASQPGTPLADITHRVASQISSEPPASSAVSTSSLKRLSGLFKTVLPLPLVSSRELAICSGSRDCLLHYSTVHLSPCIARTPYIAADLLAPHLSSGCIVVASQLTQWERKAFTHPHGTSTVSESPAWKGRRKVLLVEGKRKSATLDVVSRLQGMKLKEKVEIWDWRMLEACGCSGQGPLPLGILEWDHDRGKMRAVEAPPWMSTNC